MPVQLFQLYNPSLLEEEKSHFTQVKNVRIITLAPESVNEILDSSLKFPMDAKRSL